jgi:hypothetical protein
MTTSKGNNKESRSGFTQVTGIGKEKPSVKCSSRRIGGKRQMGKRYLIVKIAENIGHVLSVIPLPGIFTLQAAEQVVREIITADPSEKVMIQEVGAA